MISAYLLIANFTSLFKTAVIALSFSLAYEYLLLLLVLNCFIIIIIIIIIILLMILLLLLLIQPLLLLLQLPLATITTHITTISFITTTTIITSTTTIIITIADVAAATPTTISNSSTARDFLLSIFQTQNSTHHSLCNTSYKELDGMRKSPVDPPRGIDLMTHHTMYRCSTTETHVPMSHRMLSGFFGGAFGLSCI